MTAADLYHGWFYHHGALRLSSSLGWGMQMLREDARRWDCASERSKLEAAWANIRAQARRFPMRSIRRLRTRKLPAMCAIGFRIASRASTGRRRTSATRLDRIQVPALHISGWFDTYLEGSLRGIALREGAGRVCARINI
jgi:predicted acyl esterase